MDARFRGHDDVSSSSLRRRYPAGRGRAASVSRMVCGTSVGLIPPSPGTDQTRVSSEWQRSAPSTLPSCRMRKLERRHSRMVEAISSASPQRTGARNFALMSTSGKMMAPSLSLSGPALRNSVQVARSNHSKKCG